MKKAVLSGLVLMAMSFLAEAMTPHRWPLDYYASPAYSRWYDHNHNDAISGTSTCSGAGSTPCPTRIYSNTSHAGSDAHHGTDIRGNGTPTNVRAGFTGSLYERKNDCNEGEGLTSTCGGSYGNHVKMLHNDGSGRVSIYGHMLKGTVVGIQTTLCGNAVGQMGNSGASSGTHLHIEIWAHQNVSKASPHTDRLDFFGGPGNTSNTGTFWVSQGGTGVPIYPSTICQ